MEQAALVQCLILNSLFKCAKFRCTSVILWSAVSLACWWWFSKRLFFSYSEDGILKASVRKCHFTILFHLDLLWWKLPPLGWEALSPDLKAPDLFIHREVSISMYRNSKLYERFLCHSWFHNPQVTAVSNRTLLVTPQTKCCKMLLLVSWSLIYLYLVWGL